MAKLPTWATLSSPVEPMSTARRSDRSGSKNGVAEKVAATTAAPAITPDDAWGRTAWITLVGRVVMSSSMYRDATRPGEWSRRWTDRSQRR